MKGALMNNDKSAPVAVTTCRFCSHLRAESQAGNIDTPWMRDSEYAALVTVGSLVPGWSLICPVGHGLNLSSHYKEKVFWRFCHAAAKIVDQNYGPVTIFEHGARHYGSPTGCGTNHAHLHLVPLSFDLAVETIRFDRTHVWERCLITEVEERSAGREYLFLSTKLNGPETEGLICTPNEPISQFFRRVIANRIGLGNFFDYRRYQMMEIGQSSFARLSVAAGSLQRERTAS
jgi:diadenosine tetraphosphate (Ap4A) HIT family hydrolase